MKVNHLEDLINYIYYNVMEDDYDRYIKLVFGENEILIFVFESEIPIAVSYHRVYSADFKNSQEQICAEICAELLRSNIGKGYLKQLDDICNLIEENAHIFEKLLKKGE